MVAGAIEYGMFSYSVWICACYALLVVEYFLYAMAMTECIKQNLTCIKQCGATEEQSELLEQFNEYIEFYSRAKQLSSIFGLVANFNGFNF